MLERKLVGFQPMFLKKQPCGQSSYDAAKTEVSGILGCGTPQSLKLALSKVTPERATEDVWSGIPFLRGRLLELLIHQGLTLRKPAM